MQSMQFNQYVKESYSQGMQNVAIGMIEKNQWLRGRFVGMIIKPFWSGGDAVRHAFLGLKETFCYITIHLPKKTVYYFKATPYTQSYSASKALVHFLLVFKFVLDIPLSSLTNGINPTLYKKTDRVKPPKPTPIDPAVNAAKDEQIRKLMEKLAKQGASQDLEKGISTEEAEALRESIKKLASEKEVLEKICSDQKIHLQVYGEVHEHLKVRPQPPAPGGEASTSNPPPQVQNDRFNITTQVGFDAFYEDLMELDEDEYMETINHAVSLLKNKAEERRVWSLFGKKIGFNDENRSRNSDANQNIPSDPTPPPAPNLGVPPEPPLPSASDQSITPPPPPPMAPSAAPSTSSPVNRPTALDFSAGRSNLKKVNVAAIQEHVKNSGNAMQNALVDALVKLRPAVADTESDDDANSDFD